jgi:hypothetical protein
MAINDVAPSVSATVTENNDGGVSSEPDDDPDAVGLAEHSEELMEGNNDEDSGNITSGAYQQQRQECKDEKLQLIESSWSKTCKCGGN